MTTDTNGNIACQRPTASLDAGGQGFEDRATDLGGRVGTAIGGWRIAG
ncbi:hypothetical protein [Microvirga massiliensis]|nr:hypothetical protein [Microvirga massiliensis]